MPSLCPVCGRMYCDHTASEREQTDEEMMRDPSQEEIDAWRNNSSDSEVKIAVARKHSHDPVKKEK